LKPEFIMRNAHLFVAAAAFSIGGFLIPCSSRADAPVAGQPPSSADGTPDVGARNPADMAPADRLAPGSNLPDAEVRGIQALLKATVDHAMTPGDSEGLTTLFCRKDRDRFTQDAKDNAPLNGDLPAQLTRFRGEWKEKYGHDFKLEGKAGSAFDDIHIRGGPRDSNAPVATSDAPTPAKAANAQLAAEKLAADAERQNYATVFLPALPRQAGLGTGKELGPAIGVVREDGSWRIALPLGLTPEQLRERLIRHVIKFEEAKATWPDDSTSAGYVVAYQVLRSFAQREAEKNSGNDVHNGINDTNPDAVVPTKKR
jgi:hypothetical protein